MPFEPDKPTGRFEPAEQIPGQSVTAPTPTAEPEGRVSRVLRKAGEAATAVGPVGLAAGGALRLAGRAPQAVQAMAGPVEKGARTLAQALTPQSLRQLGGAVTSAGLAGGAGELARQTAEAGGAGKTGQQLAEMGGAFVPSGAAMAAKRAAAPIVEAAGKRLYTPPADVATPQTAEMRRSMEEAGVRLLPSEVRQSRGLKAVERVFQLLPGSKQEFQKFGRENQKNVNLAVAKAFGGVEPSLAPQAMRDADAALRKGYSTLLDDKTFRVSKDIGDNLSTAFNQNEQLREFAVGNAKVSNFAQSLAAGDEISGRLWKEVRSEVARYVSGLEGPSKLVGGNVLRQFDEIAKKNLGKAEHDVLMGIDRKYAALKSFEDAYSRNPAIVKAGDVDLNKFAQQYAGVEPMNILYGRVGGRGGEYVPLAQAAQTYGVFTRPRVPETQATTLGGLTRAATGVSLFGGGLAGGVPYLPAAGAAYLATPPLARGAAKAYLSPEETAAQLRQAGVSPFAAMTAAQVPLKEQK